VRAVFPGSFDPMTNGHHDVVLRVSGLVSHLTIAVLNNPAKATLFGVDERVDMARQATQGIPHVEVTAFSGLLVDLCRVLNVRSVIRGVRGGSDAEAESRMAQMNRFLGGVETFLVPTSPEFAFVSSSLVRDVARNGGDCGKLVPESVYHRLRDRSGPRA
jgi:pantetheine-phosphate adenylyltransferase